MARASAATVAHRTRTPEDRMWDAIEKLFGVAENQLPVRLTISTIKMPAARLRELRGEVERAGAPAVEVTDTAVMAWFERRHEGAARELCEAAKRDGFNAVLAVKPLPAEPAEADEDVATEE